MVAEVKSIGIPVSMPPVPEPSLYERLFNFESIFFFFIPLFFVVWGIILLIRLKNHSLRLLNIAVILPLITAIFSLLVYATVLLPYENNLLFILSPIFAFLAGVTSIVLSIISLIKNERTSLHWWVFAYSISYLFVSFISFISALFRLLLVLGGFST